MNYDANLSGRFVGTCSPTDSVASRQVKIIRARGVGGGKGGRRIFWSAVPPQPFQCTRAQLPWGAVDRLPPGANILIPKLSDVNNVTSSSLPLHVRAGRRGRHREVLLILTSIWPIPLSTLRASIGVDGHVPAVIEEHIDAAEAATALFDERVHFCALRHIGWQSMALRRPAIS